MKRVSSKMDVFRRDLHIHGLRSTIGVTVQKVKIWSTLEPLSNQLKYNLILGRYILLS
jgi:hypothetical protein